MRPETKSLMSHVVGGVLESLGDFQESGTDAGLDHMDALVDASRSALSMVEGQQPGEFPQEAKEALGRVVQIIKDTMIPTLVDLHTEDQKLVDIVHQEVADCNDGMTKRLEGDIGQNKDEAEKLRDEEADLAQQVADLQSQNISKHEQLAALMSNRQPPSLCSSFPDLPVEDLWEAYYRRVEEYSASAAAEAKNLQDRRNERDSIVSSLVSTTDRHMSTAAALSVSFCDWSRNLQAACSTHDECYADTSDRMQAQLESFRDARDKRIAAYRAALKLIDDVLTVMHENKGPMPDDAETRFPPSGKEVPEKAECDLGSLDEWDASIYGCDAKDGPMAAIFCDLDPSKSSGAGYTDTWSGTAFNTPAPQDEAGIKVWNLDTASHDAAYFERAGGPQWTVGQEYTHCAWIKWRESDATWRTLFRGNNDHDVMVKERDTYLGMFSSRNGGFRSAGGYRITKGSFQFVCVVGRGLSRTGSGGVSEFFVGSLSESPTLVGQSDRVVSGTRVWRIGWPTQGPGKLARWTAWDYALTDGEMTKFWRLSNPQKVARN